MRRKFSVLWCEFRRDFYGPSFPVIDHNHDINEPARELPSKLPNINPPSNNTDYSPDNNGILSGFIFDDKYIDIKMNNMIQTCVKMEIKDKKNELSFLENLHDKSMTFYQRALYENAIEIYSKPSGYYYSSSANGNERQLCGISCRIQDLQAPINNQDTE